MTKRGQHSISAICQNTFLDLVQDLSTSVKRTEPRVLGHHVLYILYALGAPRSTRDATRATLGAQCATLCATPPNWQQLSPEPIRICQCKKERCTEGDRIAWFADNSQEQSQFAHLANKRNPPLPPPPPAPHNALFGAVKPLNWAFLHDPVTSISMIRLLHETVTPDNKHFARCIRRWAVRVSDGRLGALRHRASVSTLLIRSHQHRYQLDYIHLLTYPQRSSRLITICEFSTRVNPLCRLQNIMQQVYQHR